MRKSARKAAFFFSTAILIMVLCNGCAIKLAQSAADHIYENYAVEGKSPVEVAADTMTGMTEDLMNSAADLGTELGIAAAEIAEQLGTALGSVFNGQTSPADKNGAINRAGQELLEKGADSLDKTILDTVDNLNMNIDRYSDLIRNGRQESGVVMPEKSDLLGPYLCDYVFDGDTISLCPEANEALGLPAFTRYRLIGIDCPERVSLDPIITKRLQSRA